MHNPPLFQANDHDVLELVAGYPLADVVALHDGALVSSPVPMIRRGSSMIGHVARPNQLWRCTGSVLAIFNGPSAYVSPRWYPTKQEHGRVVPTWNYEVVHARGTLAVHHDTEWKLDVVTALTEHFEGQHIDRWQVSDAPADFIEGLLEGIVGIEIVDLTLTGKQKLSQNRPAVDHAGVVAALNSGSTSERMVGARMSNPHLDLRTDRPSNP